MNNLDCILRETRKTIEFERITCDDWIKLALAAKSRKLSLEQKCHILHHIGNVVFISCIGLAGGIPVDLISDYEFIMKKIEENMQEISSDWDIPPQVAEAGKKIKYPSHYD